MFTEKFGRYVAEGDSIACENAEGFTARATVRGDADSGTPWERDCGHGPVSEWTNRAKRPGERILSRDRDSYRYYDFAEAVKIAKRDGWGAPKGFTGKPGEEAEAAALHDLSVLRAWCNDQWHYVGVVVSVWRAGVKLADESLWGIECNYPGSDNDYLREVANELLGEAVKAARAKLAELCT